MYVSSFSQAWIVKNVWKLQRKRARGSERESIHSLTHSFIIIFFSFKKPKHDEENGDKEGSWKPPSGVNTTSVGQLANVLKQGIPTQLKSTKVCMYLYTHTHTHIQCMYSPVIL